MATNAKELKYWYLIKVKTKMGGDTVEILRWENHRQHTFNRFRWYFKYRAALIQIKYPKYEVDCTWGNDFRLRTPEEAMKDKIIGKKATLTKYRNLLKKAEDSWVDLFPIDSNPDYIKAVNKINRLQLELKQLENEQKESAQICH